MASHNLSYSGSTSVLEASATVTEKTTTGTTRTIHIRLFISPKDYSGDRSFGFNASCGDQSSSGNGQVLNGSGYTIFDKDVTVNVPYGSTTASIDLNFSATVVSPSAGNKSISGTITRVSGLTLQQGSTSISSVGDVTLGNSCRVTWTPSSSSNYNKLKFTLGSWSYTTGLFCPRTTSAYTYTGYTIPLTAANQIPNAESAVMTVTLYTYSNSSGTSQVGTASSMDFTVTVPTSAVPTVGTVSISIDNSSNSAVNSWGIAVAGYSKLKITASASGSYGSTISRFIITGAYDDAVSGTSLSYTGKVIQSSGDKTITIVCVDSRGRKSAAKTTTAVSFLSYTAPAISQFTAEKNANGYACLKAIFSYDTVGGKNSATAVVWYRKSGSTAEWTRYGNISNNSTLTTTILLSDESSYNFRVELSDSTGNKAEKVAFLSTAKVLLDFRKDGDGLGIGKICENPGLEVSMDATFWGAIKIGEQTLKEFIQDVMKILPSTMYGSGDPPTGASIGQIYFKKL